MVDSEENETSSTPDSSDYEKKENLENIRSEEVDSEENETSSTPDSSDYEKKENLENIRSEEVDSEAENINSKSHTNTEQQKKDTKPTLEEFSGTTTSESEDIPIDTTNAMSARDLEAVYGIPVRVSAVLGKAKIQISQLLKLEAGVIVELDRKVGEAIDIYVNDRLVARGEVVIVDEKLGVTMTEIVKSEQQQ